MLSDVENQLSENSSGVLAPFSVWRSGQLLGWPVTYFGST
jgi:hypothetical protein